MAERLRIRYASDAIDDLDVIFNYISQDNRSAALMMLDRIETSILKLGEKPRLGVVLASNYPSQAGRGYRYIVINPYIIFYRIGKDEIFISRILHCRQDWMNLLFSI